MSLKFPIINIIDEFNHYSSVESMNQFLNIYAKKNENGTFIIPPMACWFTGSKNSIHQNCSFEECKKVCDTRKIKYEQVTFNRPSPETLINIFLGDRGIEVAEASPVILKYFKAAQESISEKHKNSFSSLYGKPFDTAVSILAMVFSNMLKNSNSHNFEALAKIIGKLDPRDMAPFDGFPEAAILGDRNLIDSLLRGSRRRHDSELNHNWFDNDTKGPLQALYVEDIILLLRKSNLAEVAVELLEKEIKHIDDAVVSKIYYIKQCGDLLPAILKLKDEQLRDKCLALPVIKSLVQWKWNSLYKVLILEFVFYIALIALYTLWVSHLPLENATSKDIAPNLVYCMLSLMGPFTMIEFAQKRPRATALIGKLQWKEILMDGTTSALIFLTIISSLYENSVSSFYHNIAVACTML